MATSNVSIKSNCHKNIQPLPITASHEDKVNNVIYFAIVSSINDLLLIPFCLIFASILGVSASNPQVFATCYDQYINHTKTQCSCGYETNGECEDADHWTDASTTIGPFFWVYEGMIGIALQLLLFAYHILRGKKTILKSFVYGFSFNGRRHKLSFIIFGIRLVELIVCIIIIATYKPLDCACVDPDNIYEETRAMTNRGASLAFYIISLFLILLFLLSRRILLWLIGNIKITKETHVLLLRIQYISPEYRRVETTETTLVPAGKQSDLGYLEDGPTLYYSSLSSTWIK